MAEWSQLPIDLLQEIQSHFTSQFSTVRLRSTCSTWRYSIQFNDHHQVPYPLCMFFTKRSILLLSPSPTPNSPKPISWIIKTHQVNHQRFNLYYPLSKTRIDLLDDSVPGLLDLLNIRITELGFAYCYHGLDIIGEKIAFLMLKNNNFMFLTIHVSGNLAIFSNVSMKWDTVDCLNSLYDDVIAFNGDFYAVDNVGKTVVLGFDLNDCNVIVNENVSVRIVAESICGGDKKRLVDMNGELMLVDVYIGLSPFLGENDDDEVYGCNVIGLDEFVVSRSIWFRVFKLDWKRMEWVQVKDLGNNVLFLGVSSTFAASADDLHWEKGNCICFNFPQLFYPSRPSVIDEDDKVVKYHCGGVYNLEDATISFAKVFWPPPSWVTSSS